MLFEEFPPITTEEWMAVVEKDLKGQPFEKLVGKTLDGLEIRPFYRKEDLPESAKAAPGQNPFRRGYRTDSNDWQIRVQIRETDLDAANAHAIRALMAGAQELSILTYPMGVPVRSQADFSRLLSGIYLEMVSLHWMAGPATPQVYAMLLNEAERREISSQQLSGSLDLDPILDRATGWVDGPLEEWADEYFPLLHEVLKRTPSMTPLTIRGGLIEKSGASVAQELALILALWTEYLSEAQARGVDLPSYAARTEIRLAIGSHYFLEIAKIRACRVLVSNLLEAFGIEGVRPHIHVDTTSSNKTLYDPHNNLLRATTEGMAAALGGIDSLTLAAFDQGYNSPDEFSEHLARNTESLLKEEAFLTKVVDPLGGSYYVENLTESLAVAAWELFREIEAQGGFIAAWKSGWIAGQLERVQKEKARRVDMRRTPIVGTTVFPNPSEQRLAEVSMVPLAGVLRPWSSLAIDFDDLRAKVLGGAGIDLWSANAPLPSTCLNAFRPAWPIEHLRLQTERADRKTPLVYLAKMGDPKRAKARAGFAAGFFGAAGYQVHEPISNQDAAACAKEAKELGADIVVLCSDDSEYADLLPAFDPSETILVIAGNPENASELQAAGAHEFVHIKSPLAETLWRFHAALKIAEAPSNV